MTVGLRAIGPTLRATTRHKAMFTVVVLQLASSFTIIAALLVTGSWYRIVGHADIGYDVTELVGVTVRAPSSVESPAEASGDSAGAARRLAALPGVMGAAPLSPPLRAEEGSPTIHSLEGRDMGGWTVYTSPALIDVLGLRFVEGGADARPAADGIEPIVVTRYVRDALLPGGGSLLGRIIQSYDAPPGRVVGVVESIRLREPFYPQPSATVFRLAPPPPPDDASVLLRARPGERAAVAAAVRAAMGPDRQDRLVSIVSYGVVTPRIRGVTDGLVQVFGIVGVTIAIVALVGALAVSAFVVSARRRDVGIRRALGARRRDILGYFLVESAMFAALGTGLGLGVTIFLLRGMRKVLVGLPLDWRHLSAAAALLCCNAIGAALLPARRAARIPPSLASRGG